MHAEEDRAVYGLSIPWDLLKPISILPTTLDPVTKLREFIRSAQFNAVEHANAKKAIELKCIWNGTRMSKLHPKLKQP